MVVEEGFGSCSCGLGLQLEGCVVVVGCDGRDCGGRESWLYINGDRLWW